MPTYKLKSEDAKKSATRADGMMLAITTESEFSKMRSWISARFDTVEATPFKCSPSPSAQSESLRQSLPTPSFRFLVGAKGREPGAPGHAGEATHIGRNCLLPIGQ